MVEAAARPNSARGSSPSATPRASLARTAARSSLRAAISSIGCGRVEAEQLGRRVALADQREIAAGAAADVEDVCPGCAPSSAIIRSRPSR